MDDLADFLESQPTRKVTESPLVAEIQATLGNAGLPQEGMDTNELLGEVTEQLVQHSLFNGHPRFWGYVTSSPAPIGALGDFLASMMNQNVGAWQLSPMASEIEAQTIRWIAEFVGYPSDCGGLMVSGGNMANFVGFLAGRKVMTPWEIRKEGFQNRRGQVRVYCSDATHTWIQKATDLFGLGTDAIRWISSDRDQHMDVGKFEEQIEADKALGLVPLLVAASAGTVATGAVDPVGAIADLCERHGLWFHVDGAYFNELNEALLSRLQEEGDVFLSNAILQGDYVLRACIVNFRTSLQDVQMLPDIVARIGHELDSRLRP